MRDINQISIIGVGLIGGSLGLSFKKTHPELNIVGFASQETLRKAIELGAIDRGAQDLESSVQDADLVILATPILTILDIIPKIAPRVKSGAIVTDVGSVKGAIVECARRNFRDDVLFIGGHPMAGSEKEGIAAADPFLFENAVYVMCLPESERAESLNSRLTEFIGLIEATGARILFLQPDVHDKVAAAISHLPQMLAVALMNMVGELNETNPSYLQLAAGGFRDLTRIASSPFKMWSDILATNSKAIIEALSSIISRLSSFKSEIEKSDLSAFEQEFNKAKTLRGEIPKNTKGFLKTLYDVFVFVPDRPGVISTISTALFHANINIKDIELLKIREGTGGTFRLSFETEKIAQQAMEIINKVGYKAFTK